MTLNCLGRLIIYILKGWYVRVRDRLGKYQRYSVLSYDEGGEMSLVAGARFNQALVEEWLVIYAVNAAARFGTPSAC